MLFSQCVWILSSIFEKQRKGRRERKKREIRKRQKREKEKKRKREKRKEREEKKQKKNLPVRKGRARGWCDAKNKTEITLTTSFLLYKEREGSVTANNARTTLALLNDLDPLNAPILREGEREEGEEGEGEGEGEEEEEEEEEGEGK